MKSGSVFILFVQYYDLYIISTCTKHYKVYTSLFFGSPNNLPQSCSFIYSFVLSLSSIQYFPSMFLCQ